MDRQALLAYLVNDAGLHRIAQWEFQTAGMVEEDAANGYGPVLDSTFTALGFPGSEQNVDLPSLKEDVAKALAKYFALKLMLESVAPYNIDVFNAIKSLLTLQAQLIAQLGYPNGIAPAENVDVTSSVGSLGIQRAGDYGRTEYRRDQRTWFDDDCNW